MHHASAPPDQTQQSYRGGRDGPRIRRCGQATAQVVCILPAVQYQARSYGVSGQPMTRSLRLSWTGRSPLEPQAQRAFHSMRGAALLGIGISASTAITAGTQPAHVRRYQRTGVHPGSISCIAATSSRSASPTS